MTDSPGNFDSSRSVSVFAELSQQRKTQLNSYCLLIWRLLAITAPDDVAAKRRGNTIDWLGGGKGDNFIYSNHNFPFMTQHNNRVGMSKNLPICLPY